MRIMSAVNTIGRVEVRKPAILGPEEIRFPAAVRQLIAGKAADYPESEATTLLAQHGREGLVAVNPGESDADALLRAKSVRMDYCRRSLYAYRQNYAAVKARGGEPTLPGNVQRGWLKEYRALRKELGEDEVLTATDVPGVSNIKDQTDTIGEEMRPFGLSEDIAPTEQAANLGGFDL
jgi:hypothetical protein